MPGREAPFGYSEYRVADATVFVRARMDSGPILGLDANIGMMEFVQNDSWLEPLPG